MEILGGLQEVERRNLNVFGWFLFGPFSKNLGALLEYSNTSCFLGFFQTWWNLLLIIIVNFKFCQNFPPAMELKNEILAWQDLTKLTILQISLPKIPNLGNFNLHNLTYFHSRTFQLEQFEYCLFLRIHFYDLYTTKDSKFVKIEVLPSYKNGQNWNFHSLKSVKINFETL